MSALITLLGHCHGVHDQPEVMVVCVAIHDYNMGPIILNYSIQYTLSLYGFLPLILKRIWILHQSGLTMQ